MGDVKLDPELCRALAEFAAALGRQCAAQLTAAAELDDEVEAVKHILGAGFSGETPRQAAERVEVNCADRARERDALRAQLAALKPLTAADVRAVALEVATTAIQQHPVPLAWREPLARDIADRLAERLGGRALSADEREVLDAAKAWRATPPIDAPVSEGGTTAPWVRALTRLERAVDRLLLATAFDGAARAITGQPSADLDLRLDSALIADPDNRFDSSDAEDLLPITTLGGPHE